MFQAEEPREGFVLRRRRELGDFLRHRRTRLQPAAVGLHASGRRHVKGLRREEVAELAGISFATYAALEQGRLSNVTARTLFRVAAVLGFDEFERHYLATLASPSETIAPVISAEIDAFRNFVRTYPLGCAHMADEAMDLQAFNDRADEFFRFSDLERPNLLLAMCHNEELRWRMIEPDWESTFRTMIGTFRLLYGTFPTLRATEVIASMRDDPLFSSVWREQGVVPPPLHAHIVDHPRDGRIAMQLLPLQVPSAPTNILMLTTWAPYAPDKEIAQ